MSLRWIALLGLLITAGCLLIPDDQERGTRVSNIRPEVRITAGAATSDSAGIDYKVRFQWLGSDEDGVVRRFQYAVDDTTTETAWRDTTGFSVGLNLRATSPRENGGGDPVFSDWHTFYVRAIDNEFAVSKVDHRFFNARTIAPTSKITFPRITAGAPTLVKTFIVEWEGEDLDSSLPEREPAFYEYKLIRLPTQFFSDSVIRDSLYAKPNLLLDTLRAGDRNAWIRVGKDVRQRTLSDLQDTGAAILVFGLRAVDEAGAVEPFLKRGDNFILFHVQDRNSQPFVRVTERSLGSHLFPSDGSVWRIEVPTNTPIRFRWTGDASYYGSKVGNVNYGLDVPDPADPRYLDPQGIGGWIGWSDRSQLASPFIFPDSEHGQTHIFYLQMKDAGDQDSSIRLCTVVMQVVAFTFERAALLVDDARIGYGHNGRVQDEIHDAFIDRFIGRMHAYAPQGIDRHSMYRARGQFNEGLNPTDNERIPLAELARYEALLWSFNHNGGETTGIWHHERPSGGGYAERRQLSSYVQAGGKLFLFGGRFLTALMGRGVNILYPKLPPQAGPSAQDFTDDSFIWRFLHVRSQVIGITPYDCYSTPPNDHQTWRDGLIRCVSENPAYPDLRIDPAKHDTEARADCPANRPTPTGGIKDWEGILFQRAYSPLFPEAGLDTLYTAEFYSWIGSSPTHWSGAVVGQRYESTRADTLSGTQQGRVVLFQFQPYPFYEGPATDAGTAAINWLMTGQDY